MRKANTRICPQCGKSFYRTEKHATRRSKISYCSHACSGAAERGENNPSWQGGMIERKCETCQKVFFVKRGQVRRNARYCSKTCRGVSLSGEKSPLRKERTKKPCGVCGKIMMLIPAIVDTKKYCSMACKNKAHSEVVKGENNPRYAHGQANAPYGMGFTKELKEKIRNRYGRRCLRCGCDEKKNKKRLDVHHLDYDKNNADIDNLVPLCRLCHGGVHGSKEERELCKKELSALSKEYMRNQEAFTI